MKYYLAPMEGITGYLYRNAYHKVFRPMDKYFSPFLSPNESGKFSGREWNDIAPEHNEGLNLIPQILTNRAEAFVHTAGKLKELGYEEVNLNLGCPSGTVVAKRKGSGFLAFPEKLDHFFDYVFSHLDMKVSVKTRLGKDNPEEFYRLIEIYNRYPLEELMIHPRVQKDFYKGTPNMEIFGEGLSRCGCPVCYNGNLFSVSDYRKFVEVFPQVEILMFGRGIIGNPGLLEEVWGYKRIDQETLKCFHDTLLEGYTKVLSGDRNVLFKMKEVWYYMAGLFADNGGYLKRIKKAENIRDYEIAVNSLFREQGILEEGGFTGMA